MMIQISSKDTLYMYNLYHIVKAFFPNEEISQNLDEKQESLVSVKLEEDSCFYVPVSEIADCPDCQDGKKKVTKLVYDWLSKVTGRTLAWGMLTGVRPTKLAMQKLEAGMSRKEVCTFLEQEYGVSNQKAELGIAIAEREKELLGRLDYEQGFSLYVGIPFCPSICSYCSFSSSPLAEWEDRVDDYLKALCQEIRSLGKMAEGRKLNTIYIGGGTPTTLEAEQLFVLLDTIQKSFSFEVSAGVYDRSGKTGQHYKRKAGSNAEISGDPDFCQSPDHAAENAGSGGKKAYRSGCKRHFPCSQRAWDLTISTWI